MVLIISEKRDITTNYVVDWLLFYKSKFKRLNTENFNTLNSFLINSQGVDHILNGIDNKEISCIWHRRGRLRFYNGLLYENNNNLNTYLRKEEEILVKSIERYENADKKDYIGSYVSELENNKLNVLIEARKNGLKIPETLVTSSKKELLNFYKKHSSIITKDLRSPVNFSNENVQYSSIGTFVLTEEMILSAEDYFFPVFVQEKIEKNYEIRIFFYKEKMYPMAIFSQNDAKTKTDYRNYNNEVPNRCIPVKIPSEIIEKLKKLMLDLNLNTGSIDLIVNQANEYIFLEINPMGQLDWVSKNCNYYIEKQIAKDLANT